MLKSYAAEKIMQIMKKTAVEFVSVESSVYPILSLSGSAPGDVRWYPSLALGSCSRLQVIHNLWLSHSDLAGPHYFALLGFHQPWTQVWFSE